MTAAERPEADELRRRLYRPGATQEDLRQYLDGRSALVEPTAEPAPPPRRRRPRLLIAGVVVALVAVLVICASVAGTLLHRPARPHAAVPASTAPTAVRLSAGAGELPVHPGEVVGPLSTAVRLGGAAVAAERFEGVGDGTLSIHLPSAEFGTLRATVLVYSSRTSTISWTALRPPSGDVAVIARARVVSHVDDASPTSFTYAGGPPTRIVIAAPDGLRWTVLVAPG